MFIFLFFIPVKERECDCCPYVNRRLSERAFDPGSSAACPASAAAVKRDDTSVS